MAVAIVRTADPAGVAAVSFIATYSSVSIGTASSDRVIAVACTSSSGTTTPASATIDYGSGDVAMNATTLIQLSTLSNRIFYLAVATGTTATIKVTFSTSTINSDRNHIVVYAVTGSSDTLNSSGSNTNSSYDTDPLTSGAITVPSGGGLLASICGSQNATGVTWSSATEDIDATTGLYRYSAATRVISGTVTVTCTTSAEGADGVLSFIIFGPSGASNISTSFAGAGNLSVNTVSLNQQISARFDGAGSLYGTLVPNTFQFVSAVFGGSGNLRASFTQSNTATARFVGSGNLSVNTLTPFLAIRSRFVGAGSLSIETILISAPLPPDLTLHAGEWPVVLPQCPVLNGFSEQRQRNVVEFQPDVGSTKLHRRATESNMQTSVIFRMTDAEVGIFNEWYVDYQEDGTLEFTWDHPITKVSHSWMFDANEAPRIDRMTPNTFRVSFNLLRLDDFPGD